MTTAFGYRFYETNLLQNINELKDSGTEDKLKDSKNEIIEDINSQHLFKYMVIIISITYTISKFSIELNNLFGLFISILIVYYFIQYDKKQSNAHSKDISFKLKYLNQFLIEDNKNIPTCVMDYENNTNTPITIKSYLYVNPTIIVLFYNLRDYAFYNTSVFRKCLFNVNNILLLYIRMKHPLDKDKLKYNLKYNYDLAYDNYINALNNLHSMIFKIPSSKFNNIKHNNTMIKLQQILYNYLNEMKLFIKEDIKQNGLNRHSMQLESNGPNINDTDFMYNNKYNLY
jgi:hypothetical protein